MRTALHVSLMAMALVGFLASGTVSGADATFRQRAAQQQSIRIESPANAAARAGRVVVESAPAATPAATPASPAAAAAAPGAAAAAPALAMALRKLELSRADDQQSAAKVKEKITRAIGRAGEDAVILPGATSVPLAGGATVEIRHVVMHGDRLVYNAETDEFVGTIRVGAVAYGGQAPPLLSEPVTFQVIDAGTNATAMIIVKTLAPPFEPIPVKVRNPRPPVKLRVASGSGESSKEIDMPLEPTLFVRPVSSAIPGDGLGVTDIQVQAVADSILAGQTVLLSAEPAAEFTPSQVVLAPDGMGVAKLKSVGTGKVTITARATGFEEGTTKVDFVPVTRKLSITPSSSVIQGYGVGVTMLTITASSPDLAPDQSVVIGMVPAGNLQGKELILKQGRLDVPMQSEGRGKVEVTVSAPGFESDTTTVIYELPVQTVSAGLGGGLIGGTGRVLARSGGRRKWKALLTSLGLSVVVAVIAYVLFRIGVNVFPFTPTVNTGAVTVFALAAVAGFIGASILPGGATAPSRGE